MIPLLVHIFLTLLLAVGSIGFVFCTLVMVVSVNPYPISERKSDWGYVLFYALATVWCLTAIAKVWT